jgi:hypothetical protein
MNTSNKVLLDELYRKYNYILKPLLADLSAKTETVRLWILNEIRSFNDHIARCYLPVVDEKYIFSQLDKANGHIDRAILDCLKEIAIYYHDKFTKFENDNRRIDLTTINNGAFYRKYIKLRYTSINLIRDARIKETEDRENAIMIFQKAYNINAELDNYISNNHLKINFARFKFYKNRGSGILLWILSVIFSTFVIYLLDRLNIISFLKTLLRF